MLTSIRLNAGYGNDCVLRDCKYDKWWVVSRVTETANDARWIIAGHVKRWGGGLGKQRQAMGRAYRNNKGWSVQQTMLSWEGRSSSPNYTTNVNETSRG